jgi:single stranded DNA-binding protein
MSAHITILGNIGRAPEIKTTQSGKSYCAFSVAVNDGYGDKKETTWYSVKIFNEKSAATAAKILAKGSTVQVIGRHSARAYRGKDGSEKTEQAVLADHWTIAGGRKDGVSLAEKETDLDFPF